MKFIQHCVLFVAFFAAFTGCGRNSSSSETDGLKISKEALVGWWTVGDDSENYLKLQADGTAYGAGFGNSMRGFVYKGTWDLTADRVLIVDLDYGGRRARISGKVTSVSRRELRVENSGMRPPTTYRRAD